MSIFTKKNSLTYRTFLSIVFILLGMHANLVSLKAQCASTTAYTGAVVVGNQSWQGLLSHEFSNSLPIVVSQLGVFDDNTVPGLTGNISVGIVNDAGVTVAGPIVITGSADPLVASFRMRSITPVTLPVGTYHVVSVGFSSSDPNGNAGLGGTAVNTNSGGVLTFGLPRYDVATTFGGRPNTVDGGPTGRYHAGTFGFSIVAPTLSTTINGTLINTNNDGVDNTNTFAICSGGPSPNVTMGPFTTNIVDPLVKVYQEITYTNATQSGLWCSGVSGAGCSAAPALFAGSTNTFTKTNPSLPGSVSLKFRPYVDINSNNILDATECAGDWAVYNVTFETQAPIINCPVNIVETLSASECSKVVNYVAPVTSDLPCTGAVALVQIAGLASGNVFPLGVTTNTFRATDSAGNTSTCSFTVTLNEFQAPPLACKPVQLSLDEDCEGELDPTTVLTGWEGPGGTVLLGCQDLYEINVLGTNGEDLGNTLGKDQLGKTLQYTITHPNGFTCWGDVKVEDKIAPTITCNNVEVNCLTNLEAIGLPIVTDNCSAVAVLVNEVHEALDCDPLYIGTVTRTWIAKDAAGNVSAPCTSTISLLRSTNIGIVAPAANIKLSCSGNYAEDNKGFRYPHPSVTGIPSFNGRNLWPQRQLDVLYCNAAIDYTDDLLIDTNCKKRIRRTWTITEWWCSTSVELFLGVQMIDIVDETAPVIPQQANIIQTTQSRSCTASVVLPTLNITDNCNSVYKVFVNANDGNPSGYIPTNGGNMELGVGTHSITYTAFDNCGNSSTMQYRITVKDNTDPVAICDQFATVSIKNNGYTEVTASAIDDGSFDECGAVTLKVRRMEDPCHFGADTAWYDKVGFCCLDANTTRMVQLLVTDKGNNTNICMVSVNVQEKVNPTLTCPADVTIADCLFTFDPSLAGANSAFGAAIINDNCPANNTLNHSLTDNRNRCGVGTVVRSFSVAQNNTIYQTCSQTITFENDEPFIGDSIVWPKDYLAQGQCSFNGLLPETLPAASSKPKFSEDACDLVGMRYEDLVFPFTTNGACYKIIRTWTVIDWCQKDISGNNLTWSHEQEIKVMDNNPPVITVPVSPVVFSTLNCFSDEITLSASATDCTPANEIKWYYTIFENGNIISSGNASSVTDEFEVGEYSITFKAEDRCGNIAEKSFDFVVETTKAPTAICKNGLAATLVLMDTDGNGSGDTPMAMLTPEFFDNKSNHPCGYDISLSFSEDLLDRLAIFDCTSTGVQAIELWVTDENGNTSYCETFVDVQPNGLCPGQALSVVAGRTSMENNVEIENVQVDLVGAEQAIAMTDKNGRFIFSPMYNGGTYDVVPAKDGDDLNGVSTLDIVMIQRHILGLDKLKTPYQLIAADANNTGSVTASDLTELRKLVLGINASLPNNTSWRFVDGSTKFVDVTDPWAGGLNEKYTINKLNSNMDVNFVGIKIGDVNGNAVGANLSENVSSRASHQLSLMDRKVMKGEILEIPVVVDNNATIYGIQALFVTKGINITNIKEKSLRFSSDDYIIDPQSAGISIAMANGARVTKDKVLFTIEVEVLESGLLSNMLSLGQSISPEIYTESMVDQSLSLVWRTDDEAAFTLSNVTPNPWNAQTQLTFDLPSDGMVTFKVRDITGKKIISTIDQYQAGSNTIHLNRSDIGQPGVYVYELRYEDKVITGKMILIE